MPSSTKTTHLRDLFTEGLGHEDQFVREACYRYWEKQPDRGATQARRIIDALRAYGMQAFSYPHIAYEIPLDRACFEHLIETLLEADCFDDKDREHFGRWFKWCLSVEHDLLPELEAFLKSERALAFEGNGFVTVGELLESVESMRQHESLDVAACHAGIQKALDSVEFADGFPHEAVGEIESLLDQLVRIEAPERVAEWATSWLALNPLPESEVVYADDNARRDEYCFGLGVYLAGEIGLVSGIDRLIDGVSQADWDWLNESSLEALAKMPPVETTARLRERWWAMPEYGRLFFSDVFVIAHLPEHRDFYLEQMHRADDFEFEIIPHRMACALAMLGDADAIKEVTAYWEANAHDPEAMEVAELLYAIHTLRDEQPPVLDAIRERMIEAEVRHQAAQERMTKLNEAWERKMLSDQIQLPVVRKEPKVGRNEPCPCGSGKKFKKCCL